MWKNSQSHLSHESFFKGEERIYLVVLETIIFLELYFLSLSFCVSFLNLLKSNKEWLKLKDHCSLAGVVHVSVYSDQIKWSIKAMKDLNTNDLKTSYL